MSENVAPVCQPGCVIDNAKHKHTMAGLVGCVEGFVLRWSGYALAASAREYAEAIKGGFCRQCLALKHVMSWQCLRQHALLQIDF